MKVLITGGAGFIGSHTADLLVNTGHDVILYDNLSTHRGDKPQYTNNYHLIVGDVLNKEVLLKYLSQVTHVVHLAAYQDYLPNFSKFFEVNCVGTANIYELIVEHNLPIEKVVVASSQAVYGEGRNVCMKCGLVQYPEIRSKEQLEKGIWDILCYNCGHKCGSQASTEETPPVPYNQYAISKITEEQLALRLGKRYGTPTIAMRYSIVQGPRQSLKNSYSGALRNFVKAISNNMQPIIYEDGKQIRDYISIYDVAKANVNALTDDKTNYQTYNIHGEPISLLEYYYKILDLMGEKIEPSVPGKYRFGDTRHIFSRTTRDSNPQPKERQDIDTPILEFIEWAVCQDELKIDYNETKIMEALGVVRNVR